MVSQRFVNLSNKSPPPPCQIGLNTPTFGQTHSNIMLPPIHYSFYGLFLLFLLLTITVTDFQCWLTKLFCHRFVKQISKYTLHYIVLMSRSQGTEVINRHWEWGHPLTWVEIGPSGLRALPLKNGDCRPKDVWKWVVYTHIFFTMQGQL